MIEPTNKETDLLPELDDDAVDEIFTRFYVGPYTDMQHYCIQKIARSAYQLGARDHAATANSWITHRTPRRADASTDGMVIIPVGNGGTTATIDYNLVAPGQPWAFFNAKPGRFER